jgi:hypothetical protein
VINVTLVQYQFQINPSTNGIIKFSGVGGRRQWVFSRTSRDDKSCSQQTINAMLEYSSSPAGHRFEIPLSPMRLTLKKNFEEQPAAILLRFKHWVNTGEIDFRPHQMCLHLAFLIPIKSDRSATVTGEFARRRDQLNFLFGSYQDRFRLHCGGIRVK